MNNSSEENGACMRPVNLHVTGRTICILRVLIMLRTRRFNRSNVMRYAVASQTQLINGAVSQQARIRRSMWRVAGRTAFGFDRCMLISKRPLFVRVTLDTGSIATGRQARLFCLKTAVRIVAIATAHGAFQHFVVEGR